MLTGYYVKENINIDIIVLLYGGLYRICVQSWQCLAIQAVEGSTVQHGHDHNERTRERTHERTMRDTQVLQAVLT